MTSTGSTSGNGKQHATAPSYVRERRNRQAVLARAEKAAKRREEKAIVRTDLGLVDEEIEVRIVVPGRPASPNETRRRHWSADSGKVKKLRKDVWAIALDAKNRSGRADDFPLPRAELRIVFRLARMAGDLDNLLAGSKPILDGLVDAGVLRTDSVSGVGRIVLEAEKGIDEVLVVARELRP